MNWIERARTSANRADATDVLRGERPVMFDGEVARALLAPLVAAVAWAGVVARTLIDDAALDPFAFVLRFAALATTVRAAWLCRMVFERVRLWLVAPRCVLVLEPEGLYYRGPEGERVLPKSDIVGVVERGTWQTRNSGRRFSPVYLVSRSSVVGRRGAAPYLELPPIFEATPGVLAERLMRWAAIEVPAKPSFPPPHELASKVYDEAARGIRDTHTTVVRQSSRWLLRGPLASVLLGATLAERIGSSAELLAVRGMLVPLAILAAILLVLVPLLWIVHQRRSLAPQKGLAMVLTPAELLIRAKRGVLRMHWSELASVSIQGRGRFSWLEGWETIRTLTIDRKNAPSLFLDEAFLAVPSEVAAELCDAYARGSFESASRQGEESDAGDQALEPPQSSSQRSFEDGS